MYTMIINTGEIVRNLDGVVVAPTSDPESLDYLEYVDWANLGNVPEGIYSPGEDYEYVGGQFQIKYEAIKKIKLQEIGDKFTEQFVIGKFQSSLGFLVDNRRYGDKNDKDNLLSLIDLGIYFFKDANGNMHNLTLDEMMILKTEMSADGLAKYQKKWSMEAAVAAATSTSELEAITIAF